VNHNSRHDSITVATTGSPVPRSQTHQGGVKDAITDILRGKVGVEKEVLHAGEDEGHKLHDGVAVLHACWFKECAYK
jgi:hypothetical protein